MSGKSRFIVGALGVLVAGLIVGLVLMLRSGETQATKPPRDEPAADTPATAVRPEPPRPVATSAAAPADPPADPSRPVPLPPLAGNVHDHTNDAPPDKPPPIAQNTVANIRGALQLEIDRCGAGLRKLKTPSTRMVVNAGVRVRGGRVRTSNMTIDGLDKLPEDYKACVLRAYSDLDTDVPDNQTDGVSDTVHMPWVVP